MLSKIPAGHKYAKTYREKEKEREKEKAKNKKRKRNEEEKRYLSCVLFSD
jgi:hypothetical protein